MQVVGSSILFVYDDAAAADGSGPERGMAVASVGAKMIDFAKTEELPGGGRLTHTAEWQVVRRARTNSACTRKQRLHAR